ncbi:hypothetical protein [Cellulophaga baltica]|uniref:Uncharacterized protein n=1 Tax=Cellulophaga baltica 18 TaxID=1348584 RepID=A0AAU8RIY1_9FLAO|nr:hypothetical protein [Cellulophaga baltica]AIZ42373.1 hypothetical protein M666_12750 [Cellulophaga baltica 18]
MKLKRIVIHGIVKPEVRKLIHDYFSMNTENGIIHFKYSEEEFSSLAERSPFYKEFLAAEYEAIFKVDSCDIDFKAFEWSIFNRDHFYKYINATYKFCPECVKNYAKTKELLGIKIDGTVGHEVLLSS